MGFESRPEGYKLACLASVQGENIFILPTHVLTSLHELRKCQRGSSHVNYKGKNLVYRHDVQGLSEKLVEDHEEKLKHQLTTLKLTKA